MCRVPVGGGVLPRRAGSGMIWIGPVVIRNYCPRIDGDNEVEGHRYGRVAELSEGQEMGVAPLFLKQDC